MILFARSSRHGENNTSKGSLLLCKSGMSLIARSSSNVGSAVDLSLDRRVDRAIALCKQTLLQLLTTGIDTHSPFAARCSDLVCFLRVFCRVDNAVGMRTLHPLRPFQALRDLRCSVLCCPTAI